MDAPAVPPRLAARGGPLSPESRPTRQARDLAPLRGRKFGRGFILWRIGLSDQDAECLGIRRRPRWAKALTA